MEEFSFIDSENGVIGDKRKGVKSGKACTVSRKKLADISNLQQLRPSIQADKPLPISASTKDYFEQLQRENATLVMLLADRNKVIESREAELKKLQNNMKQMQQQNLQLAQANNHMLVDLNAGKDMLKALSHELGCKNGLIKSLKIVSQAMAGPATCEEIEDKGVGTAEFYQAEKDDGKPCDTNMPPQSENQTLRHSGKQNSTDATENKRRRQSARFDKADDPQPSEDVYEIDGNSRRRQSARLKPDVDLKLNEDSFKSDDATLNEDVKDEGDGAVGSRRSSVGRPQRRAAEKIQSYKENPINIKMRR